MLLITFKSNGVQHNVATPQPKSLSDPSDEQLTAYAILLITAKGYDVDTLTDIIIEEE